ncbi:Hypothetical predicted protein [Octopus vulgaris]|uniref:Uncharacterized protein n=1 Tax=Octopus vulgaris TaxID=6645 RepID=A0AA36BCF1_OCTVU|nr:Hypothetical predicted protein [Octopus vulgaris]
MFVDLTTCFHSVINDKLILFALVSTGNVIDHTFSVVKADALVPTFQNTGNRNGCSTIEDVGDQTWLTLDALK